MRTNLFRVILVTWGVWALAGAIDYILRQGLDAGAFGVGIAAASWLGTLAALTILPGAVVHWLCVTVASRYLRYGALRVVAVALSPVLGVGMYLAFRSGASDRGAVLALALAISIVYGLQMRLPRTATKSQ